MLNEFDMCVRHLSVSSNETLAHRLTDGSDSTFWQSSGPQGKVNQNQKIKKMLNYFGIFVAALDQIRDATQDSCGAVEHSYLTNGRQLHACTSSGPWRTYCGWSKGT